MKNKYLLLVVFVLSIIALFSGKNKNNELVPEEKEVNLVSPSLEISIKNPDSEEIKKISLEEYVIGVVAGEMPASFELEALKAQAVAARTFAVYKMQHAKQDYDVLTDISDQAYITLDQMQAKWQTGFLKYYQKITEAVSETKDMVMTSADEVIISYYFAISNGYTEDSVAVFGNEKSYLESVASTWDKNVKNFEVTKEFSKEEFCQKLNISCQEIKIGQITKSSTGRVNSIEINEQTFPGTKFRSLLGLRSTDFILDITDVIKITTRGYGHGVGMSQYGAQEMAKLGYTYEEILKYYYHDINLTKVNV